MKTKACLIGTVFFLIIQIFLITLNPPIVYSQFDCRTTPSSGYTTDGNVTLTLGDGKLINGQAYTIEFWNGRFRADDTAAGGNVRFRVNRDKNTINDILEPDAVAYFYQAGTKEFKVLGPGIRNVICTGTYTVREAATCQGLKTDRDVYEPGEAVAFSGKIPQLPNTDLFFRLEREEDSKGTDEKCLATDSNGRFQVSLKTGEASDKPYHIEVWRKDTSLPLLCKATGVELCPEIQIWVTGEGEPEPIPGEAGEYDPCWPGKPDTPQPPDYDKCHECDIGTTLGEPGSWTALGCIPNDPREFVAWLLARAIGIGGGIAFLLMIWGGFQVITSAGDPDRLNAGKEVITSAIAGLLLIILSLFLLQLIGVKILEIPGFEFGGRG